MAAVGRLRRRPEFLRVAAPRRKWAAPGLILQAVTIFLYVFARDAGTLYALAMVFGVAYGGVCGENY